ncbi:MAG: type VI secretion lipoprotein TssJ [Geobacteraceae bacterium]|nr:type VI secretion lipoprotein TssJ [Geobacteraceae bacterium]
MKKMLISFGVAVTCASCTLPWSSSKVQWEYEKNAIEVSLNGDPRLNLYQGKAHSLVVCIYHLRDLNGFNQLMDEKDGIPRLLECGRFDSGVTYSKRIVAQPNLETKEIMDRTEGAKYVGVVAGYYELHKDSAIRSYQIPLSLFQNPKRLLISLDLGPQGIKEIKEK